MSCPTLAIASLLITCHFINRDHVTWVCLHFAYMHNVTSLLVPRAFLKLSALQIGIFRAVTEKEGLVLLGFCLSFPPVSYLLHCLFPRRIDCLPLCSDVFSSHQMFVSNAVFLSSLFIFYLNVVNLQDYDLICLLRIGLSIGIWVQRAAEMPLCSDITGHQTCEGEMQWSWVQFCSGVSQYNTDWREC